MDPKLVEKGEREELKSFKKVGVWDHVSRDEAENDQEGNVVKVKWVRINKGTDETQRSGAG